jgi:hypothetical protein
VESLVFNKAESGLPYESELQPESITAVRKESLQQAPGTRTLAEHRIQTAAEFIVMAMGVQPNEV